jgi:hypothetical protein
MINRTTRNWHCKAITYLFTKDLYIESTVVFELVVAVELFSFHERAVGPEQLIVGEVGPIIGCDSEDDQEEESGPNNTNVHGGPV